MLKIRLLKFNPLETNCVLCWEEGSASCAVVDPGFRTDPDEKSFLEVLEAEGLSPEAILLTHGHFDHYWGVPRLLRRFSIPVYMHPADKEILAAGAGFLPGSAHFRVDNAFSTVDVREGDVLHVGGADWKVLETPGHTPGGVCYLCEAANVLLSGDTLFAGSIGRTDFPGGDYDVLMHSILDKILPLLDGSVEVIPGHGGVTNIAREAMTNPFLQPFNEPSDEGWEDREGLFIAP